MDPSLSGDPDLPMERWCMVVITVVPQCPRGLVPESPQIPKSTATQVPSITYLCVEATAGCAYVSFYSCAFKFCFLELSVISFLFFLKNIFDPRLFESTIYVLAIGCSW